MSAALMPETQPDWRLFQTFLQVQGRGVFQVEMDWNDTDNPAFRCTCPVFAGHSQCRHVDHVMDKNVENGTTFLLLRPGAVTESEIETAIAEGPETHKQLVLKYGVIEVL